MPETKIPLELNKITYRHYKNLAQHAYRYITTYHGEHESGKERYIKGWLKIHRAGDPEFALETMQNLKT